MLTKRANATLILNRNNLVKPEEALQTEGASNQFRKLVADLKRIAPKSDEFTYFRCVAIHAMEAANLDEQGNVIHKGHITEHDGNGNCKVCGTALLKDADTKEPIEGLWCEGSDVDSYCNQNGDAFPEKELIPGYKTFIGRGLFVNHASDDAEKIRGIILDAAWIPKHKCVELLVAVDKIAFPELARQIEAGYSSDVSMGTQVQYSRCSRCGRKAITENDYCLHVKGHKGLMHEGKKVYEVNNGLNFIEISIVATGADPRAKIRQILASLNTMVQNRIEKKCSGDNVCKINEALTYAKEQVGEIKNADSESVKEIISQLDTLQKNLVSIDSSDIKREASPSITQLTNELAVAKQQIMNIESKITNIGGIQMTKAELDTRASKRRAYFQGTTEPVKPGQVQYKPEPMGGPNGTAEAERLNNAKSGEAATVKDGAGKEDIALKERLQRAELEIRKMKRHAVLTEAYFQGGGGVNEPQIYPVDKMGGPNGTAEAERLNNAKSGEAATLKDGAGKEDIALKEKLQRAKLRAKFTTAQEKKDCAWTIYAGDESVIKRTVGELYGEDIDKPNLDDPSVSNWDWVSSKSYGIEAIRACKELGLVKAAELMGIKKVALQKKAEEAPAEAPAEAPIEAPAVDNDLKIDVTEPVTGTTEQIGTALTEIEEAVNEIRAINEGEEGGDLESMEAEEGLLGAEDELKGLEDKAAEMSKTPKFAEIVIEAINDARRIVTAAKGKVQKELEKQQAKCDKLKEKLKDAKKEDKEGIEKKIEKCKKKIKDCKEAAEAAAEKKKAKEKKETKGSLEERAHARRIAAGLIVAEATVAEVKTTEAVPVVETIVAEVAPAAATPAQVTTQKALNKELETTVEKKKELEAALKSRSQARWAAAEKLYGVTPSYDAIKDAHPKGGMVTEDGTGKGIKGLNDGGKVETQTEQQKKDVEIAGATPRGELTARQEMRRKLVATLDSKAAVTDGEAAKYWKDFYGQASDPTAKAFGKEMSKDTAAPKLTADTQVKMKRAYQIAMKQQEVGQVAPGKASLENQVDALMGMDDPGFLSFARAVENTYPIKKAEAEKKLTKTAGAIPVGVTEIAATQSEDLSSELSKLPWR